MAGIAQLGYLAFEVKDVGDTKITALALRDRTLV